MGKRVWTAEMENLMRKHYPTMRAHELSELFGMPYRKIKAKAANMKLSKVKTYNRIQLKWTTWPPAKLKWFKKLYATTTNADLSFIFEISKSTILKAGKALGLEKAPEMFKSGQFKPGQEPANKGKTMSSEVREKVRHTWYKKGHKPKNTLYDGAIRQRKDSRTGITYKYIRLSEGNWELLHRHVWRQHNPDQELKTEDYIRFKDGNSLNCDIGNLELITRKENMNRNTIHRYPSEVKQVIRRISKLDKKLKEHGTE